jgi:hypothetical protein
MLPPAYQSRLSSLLPAYPPFASISSCYLPILLLPVYIVLTNYPPFVIISSCCQSFFLPNSLFYLPDARLYSGCQPTLLLQVYLPVASLLCCCQPYNPVTILYILMLPVYISVDMLYYFYKPILLFPANLMLPAL